MHVIRMGVPEMESFWNDLSTRHDRDALSGSEQVFFKKLVKVPAGAVESTSDNKPSVAKAMDGRGIQSPWD